MRIIYLGLSVPNLDDYLMMMTDLMMEFQKAGHDIVLVGPSYDDTKLGLQIERGVKVVRVPTMKLFNVGKIQKGIANLLLPYQYKKALKKSGVDLNFDLVIMPTPPITLAALANWLKKKYHSKVYLILRDIFPQNAVDLKMMRKGSPAYRYFRNMEKKLYRVSDSIGCMSPKNIEFVLQHNPEINQDKLHLLPNWSTYYPILSEERVVKIKKDYGLQDKFIVMFGGNIGRPQKMENVVALAKACKDINDIFFFIIGGGTEKENLENLLAKEQLDNIKLQGFLSKKEYAEVLQIADVGLISLSEEFTIPNYPSKSIAYFNAKKPILASLDLNTDFGTQMEEIGAGLWAEAGKTEKLKALLIQLYNNTELRKKMGENGHSYMVDNLLTPKAYQTIINRPEIGA
ncbi:glycosyltransferase family 4 protein [Muriicola sp. Z0-33]|uniref:glycosyltransferase family 4 protein n=1 Tax=Muriicola sp. Z0-33 TaxID=2816957 RepID=UPI0022380E50|nr:glycosyltransferase family 4 protein [Muriicola sp. Z0-33]MCW5515608.1 glycosyltransferase family 4 protein [Muriicola sp. Z0-33]